MNNSIYSNLIDMSCSGNPLPRDISRQILTSEEIELLPLLNAAFEVRRKYVGKEVSVHTINNAQNGFCPEDCHYCPQAKSSEADIEDYPIKPDEEIFAEAKAAYERGSLRYCMVFSGRGPSYQRTEHLARLIREIKSRYPLEVCVSAGIIDEGKARIFKEAGLDRLNHNLNTSRRHYSKICTTHTYQDRVNTLQSARRAGLQVCSGVIIGMGEETEDILDMAYTLREMKAESIPVNFYIPIRGTALRIRPDMSPRYCLRVLCLFRFLNPRVEIRIAAGRELYLRGMEVMAYYPANSLFLDGYLNAKGAERLRALQMIRDAGFTIRSNFTLDELIGKEELSRNPPLKGVVHDVRIKGIQDLRPYLSV